MTNNSQKYSTNTIVAKRYNVNNVIESEIENLKFQPKIQNKYKIHGASFIAHTTKNQYNNNSNIKKISLS